MFEDNTMEKRDDKNETDPPMKRTRIGHVVPLGSIFVWTLEGVVMSGILLTVILLIGTVVGGGRGPNVADAAVGYLLVACNIINMMGHMIVANMFNRESMAMWAGGTHGALSNALCTATFASTVTYIALYVDSCLLGVPSKRMCLIYFRWDLDQYYLIRISYVRALKSSRWLHIHPATSRM